jgi:hypothetical protein
MSDGEPATDADSLPPEEAFLLLADETRARIVQELGAAWSTDWPGVVSYAELMERVGVDDSGRFNYHLSKLVGRFVSDREEGYKLNFPGLRVYRGIIAGTFTSDVTIDAFRVDSTCFECGSRLEGRYSDTLATVTCPECDVRYGEYPLPPRGATSRTPEELLVAADQRSRHHQSQFIRGVCPWCGSEPETRIETPETSDLASWASTPYVVQIVHQCADCGGLAGHSVGKRLLVQPAVVAFYYDHGIDLSTVPSWELELVVTDRFTAVESREPWRISVAVPLDGEALRVELDDSLAVVDVMRDSATSTPD